MVVISNFAPPTDGIRHQQPCTALHMNDREIGKGTLFITESRLSWVNSCSGQGFSLEYPHIALHAVSRDLSAHPQECLYIMVDTHIDGPGTNPPGNTDNEDDEFSDPGITEMRFIPDDKGMLDAMFHAMSECQALHPDPQDSNSDEEDIFEDADEDEEGEYQIGGGDAPIILTAARYQENTNGVDASEEPMDMEAGQFEDADCEPEN